MRLAFQVNPEARDGWNLKELRVSLAIEQGLKVIGRDVEVLRVDRIGDPTKYDMVGIFGVKNRKLIHACQSANVPFLYFDKAYNREGNWWKLSVNAHHPTRYFTHSSYPNDRRQKQMWFFKDWRRYDREGHILLAGSSLKYHELYGLPHPTEYWTDVVKKLRESTTRKIIYRPKQSWRDAVDIEGTERSTEDSIIRDLRGAHCMITHGSNSCFEALMEGVPAIVLGEGITAPISSTNLRPSSIDIPHVSSDAARDKILDNLAYFQWSMEELAQGVFWKVVDECLFLHKSGRVSF